MSAEAPMINAKTQSPILHPEGKNQIRNWRRENKLKNVIGCNREETPFMDAAGSRNEDKGGKD
jgi:hypothetical protein